MKVGYLIGGTLSLLLYKIDRKSVTARIKFILKTNVKNEKYVNIILLLLITSVAIMVYLAPQSEEINAIISFVVLELMGREVEVKEKKSRRNPSERKIFYDTLFKLGRALIGTFITPLIIILLFGNVVAIVYGMVYFFFDEINYGLGAKIINIIFIIPSLIGDGLLYLVYICRNGTFKISFKREFFHNLVYMPLLNIYILGAYIETVNFYYIENCEAVHYLRSYGDYQGKIDEIAIRDLVTIIYGVAAVLFILFIILINL